MAGNDNATGDDTIDDLTSPLLPQGDGADVEDPAPAMASVSNGSDDPPDNSNYDVFTCIECYSSTSNNYSSKAFEHHATKPVGRIGRSKFAVEGICCAGETPIIKSMLKKLNGVSKVNVNPSASTVFVDHDIDVISANDIAKKLSDKHFPANVLRDGAEDIMMGEEKQPIGMPTDVFVQSAFDMSTIIDGAVVNGEDDILNQIRACLNARFEENNEEVNKNHILQVSGVIFVIEHNPYYMTANGIAEILDSHFNKTVGSVKVVSDGGKNGMWAMQGIDQDETNDEQPACVATVPLTIILAGLLWFVSLFSYIGGTAEYLKYVALVSVALALPSIAIKSFQMLRQFHFDINCMVLIAAIGAVALQDFTEAAAVSFLFAISSTLESLANARARNALASLVNVRTENAHVLNENTKEGVVLPASAVMVGMILMVASGETIPCDGIVIEGSSTIDESKLTGENKPVTKVPGNPVSSGTTNMGFTQLQIKTTATSRNSAVARRTHLIEEAQASSSSDTETLINSFARIYTPIVALAALSMCTIPWAFGNEVGRYWAKNGLIAIAIACPCAIVVSAPVTHMAALAAAAQKGVLINGGIALEGLGRVKCIAFDKTGTLTKGTFQLLHFDVVGQTRSRKEVLGYLALMETPASHPLSDAIVKAAANEHVDVLEFDVQNHTLLPGEGITANIEKKHVHVGNTKLFQRLGLYDDLQHDMKVTTEMWADSGGTIGFISIEGEGIIGAYCVADEMRAEAAEVVKALKQTGIEVTMLTGDSHPAAISIGEQLGLEECDIMSDLHPKEKMREIAGKVEGNRQKRKCCNNKRAVMMVGDGVNDALALSVADVSVAMGAGTALAIDAADITLMDSNLVKLNWIVSDLGRRVIWTIIENVAFSLLVKLIVVGFAITGRASLWGAVLSDIGTLLAVTLNGTKLITSSPKKEK